MKGSIVDPRGRRLYVTPDERRHFLLRAGQLPRAQRLFCQVLAITGCRISEALNLSIDQVDIDQRVVIFETLKKRKRGVFRMVPVPNGLLTELLGLERHSPSREVQKRLWSWSRTTGYTVVKDTMRQASVSGLQACPKGLRHGFAVYALSVGVPLNMIQKWMGHSSLETTTIYLDAVGPEERAIAERMWTHWK